MVLLDIATTLTADTSITITIVQAVLVIIGLASLITMWVKFTTKIEANRVAILSIKNELSIYQVKVSEDDTKHSADTNKLFESVKIQFDTVDIEYKERLEESVSILEEKIARTEKVSKDFFKQLEKNYDKIDKTLSDNAKIMQEINAKISIHLEVHKKTQ